MSCRGYSGWVPWFLGYPDQALKRSYEALSQAQDLPSTLTQGTALHFVAQLHQIRRDVQWTQERAEEAMTLSTDQGFAQLLPTDTMLPDTMLQGWALAMQGQEEEGMTRMRRGLAASRSTGAEFALPFFLAQLVEICGKTG